MACIPVVDPTCDPLGAVVNSGVDSVFQGIAAKLNETVQWLLKMLVTGWLQAPSPILNNEDVVDNLRRYTYWAVAAIAVFSLLVASTRMVLEGKGKAATDALAGIVKLVLITALAVPLTIALTELGDSYATWIIDKSVGDQLAARVQAFAPLAQVNGITIIATIVVAFLCVTATLVQLLLSIAIGGLKVFLCGLAPLPAAASISGYGKATQARYLSWMLAALLYKPVAATIYAGAFWMIGEGTDFITVLSGVVVMIAAIIAMPALLRLLAPVTAQMSGGGSAGMGGAVGAGVGQVASGAMRLGGAGRGGGGGGGGGPQGSTAAGGGPRPAATPGQGGGAAAGGGTSAGASTAGGAGAASGGAAAGGGGAAAGAGAASGAAAAAGPVGIGVAVGAAAVKAGGAAVRKVGGTAAGAAQAGE